VRRAEAQRLPARDPKIGWLDRLVLIPFLLFVLVEQALMRLTRGGRTTFFDTADFPWIAPIEASWTRVRAELDAVLERLDRVPNFQDIQLEQRAITLDDGWKTFFFYGYGREHEKNIARCPETHRLLTSIPGLTSAFFSILKPKKRLRPHRGPYRGVLRYHLAVRVPKAAEACGIRVGDDVRRWEEGKSLVFDDTHLHEAWNDSDEVRVVLFVDFERPLPPPLAILNRWTLKMIAHTPFVKNAVRRLEAWEDLFPDEIERATR
jgi:beta-hydroxylase